MRPPAENQSKQLDSLPLLNSPCANVARGHECQMVDDAGNDRLAFKSDSLDTRDSSEPSLPRTRVQAAH